MEVKCARRLQPRLKRRVKSSDILRLFQSKGILYWWNHIFVVMKYH